MNSRQGICKGLKLKTGLFLEGHLRVYIVHTKKSIQIFHLERHSFRDIQTFGFCNPGKYLDVRHLSSKESHSDLIIT